MGDNATLLSGGDFLSFDSPIITTQRNKKIVGNREKVHGTLAKYGGCAVPLRYVFQLRHQLFGPIAANKVAIGGWRFFAGAFALGKPTHFGGTGVFYQWV
jgi:hypothetical protein